LEGDHDGDELEKPSRDVARSERAPGSGASGADSRNRAEPDPGPTIEVVYAPGTFTYTKEKVGTRYVFLGVRTLANPEDPADMKAAQAL
jgi:hypothetical protein